MQESAFITVVNHFRGSRTMAAVQLAAGFNESAVRNMDQGRRMPLAEQIDALARVLAAPADVLTRALLEDRGYTIGREHAGPVADVASLMRSMNPHAQEVLLGVAEVIRATVRD